jgi:hypothetical protein
MMWMVGALPPHLPTRPLSQPPHPSPQPPLPPLQNQNLCKENEDDEVQWRHMVTYYYRKNLGNPAEKRYMFQGWDGEEGVIKHIIE